MIEFTVTAAYILSHNTSLIKTSAMIEFSVTPAYFSQQSSRVTTVKFEEDIILYSQCFVDVFQHRGLHFLDIFEFCSQL
jgi:hypothetical protein